MSAVYTLDRVKFRYGIDPVIEDATFVIESGDYVGIIGENGSGKSTLLRLLVGEKLPNSGKIALFGENGVSPERLRRVSYVPQINHQATFTFPLSCRELVALGLIRDIGHRFFLRRAERKLVECALERFGVLELADRNITDLSGGQRQRVMIAKAMVNDPEVLIFDEPTVGIDQASKERFYEILDHMNSKHGITVILVTHEVEIGKAHWAKTLRVRDHRVEVLC